MLHGHSSGGARGHHRRLTRALGRLAKIESYRTPSCYALRQSCREGRRPAREEQRTAIYSQPAFLDFFGLPAAFGLDFSSLGNVFRASLTIRRLRRHSVFSTRFSSCWPRNTDMRRQKTAKTVSAVVPWAFHSSSRPLHGLTGIPVAAPTWPRETRGRAGSMATSCGRHSRWGPPGERSARTGCRRGWKGPARRVASAGPVPSSRARCETSCAACRRGRRQTQSWRPSSTGGWTGTAMRTAARWHGRWSNPTGARPPTSCWRGWMGWRTRCRP
mmetsp:Transcript_15416/g.50307  ORF Transcript_15416/g.50307 Transcript_15416/m.50307 type:complete len:273 (+) Transcript_15416:270-1088(+)